MEEAVSLMEGSDSPIGTHHRYQKYRMTETNCIENNQIKGCSKLQRYPYFNPSYSDQLLLDS